MPATLEHGGVVANTASATPAGRCGRPEEVAALAVYLASDEAAFIYGAHVVIDGGWTLS